MRVKVRFNAEAGQAPIVLDLRFLPRIGERLQLGFRRVVEVLEVRRVENDNRYGGIIRAKYILEERKPPPPPPRPLPMPPLPGTSAAPPLPSTPAPTASPVTGIAAPFGDVSFEELAATLQPQNDPLGHL
jgi:hypothetical protein